MVDEVNAALSRIDAALRRIENACARAPLPARELEARHAKLRSTVEESVAALDQLIASNTTHG